MNVVFNHRRIRSKEYLRSIFDSVGGGGVPAPTRLSLLQRFPSSLHLANASVEMLAGVEGVTPDMAAALHSHFAHRGGNVTGRPQMYSVGKFKVVPSRQENEHYGSAGLGTWHEALANNAKYQYTPEAQADWGAGAESSEHLLKAVRFQRAGGMRAYRAAQRGACRSVKRLFLDLMIAPFCEGSAPLNSSRACVTVQTVCTNGGRKTIILSLFHTPYALGLARCRPMSQPFQCFGISECFKPRVCSSSQKS